MIIGGVRFLLCEGVPMPPKLMTEEMLFATEWPRSVDAELTVSEETVESGRGMYSTFSEKPTRGREGGRAKVSEHDSVGGTESLDWVCGEKTAACGC